LGIFKLIGDAVMMDADLSQVAGPVGIVGLVGEASAYGVTALLMFTAFISLNLAVINVLPFPALDGGRFVMVLIEAVKGSPITPKYAATVNAIGFFVLIALMVVVTWSDIAKLL
jgi:regulator of sigma E protease